MQEFWATAKLHQHSIRFKMDTRKHALDLEAFREMLHISPRISGQSFAELSFEEEILEFLRFFGHSTQLKTLTDVNVNKLYQPWRSFAAVINKCLTGKSFGIDSLRLSATAKGKQPARATTPTESTDIERTETEQLKIVLRRSRQEMYISQQCSFNTDGGIGSKPGVLDVPSDDSEEELSWNSSLRLMNKRLQRVMRVIMKQLKVIGKVRMKRQGNRKRRVLTQFLGLLKKVRKITIMRRIKGRGLQVSQETEDSHVILTPTQSDAQQESLSTSSFMTNLLNPIIDPGLESIFMSGSTTVTPIPSPQSTMTPSIISTFTTASQLSTPPTQIPSLDLQSLPTFASVFCFEDRVKFFEDNFSNILGIVNQYMHQQMPEAIREAVQTQTDRLQDSIQRENDEFLKTINKNMKKIIKEQVKTQVKAQVTRILPRIEESVNAQLEAKVLTRSSHSSRTSYVVAVDLSEIELKKILIDKMEGNKSIQRSDEQRNLYKALVKAYDADKTILDTYGESTILKQRREDDDQEGPSAGSDRGSKRQREGGEHASASTPYELATGSARRSTTGSQSRQLSATSTPYKPATGSTGRSTTGSQSRQLSASAEDQPIVQTSQHPEWFSQPNFSNFIINRLGVDTLTPELLAGPTYELMRGSCNSLTELEYHLEEVYKATRDQLDWVNPEVNWESALDVYSKKRIIAVTELKIVEWHNYKHLDWISLSNLTVEERFAFNVSLRMFTRSIVIQRHVEDLQLGVDSYQKRLNLTKPDTDGTLNDVRNALDDRLKGIRMQYLPTTIWRKGDKDRATAMIKAIDKMLKTRRIMRSLERENDEFLKTIDENMKKIIKEQVKSQVKAQVTRILPRIEEAMNAQLEAKVLTRSSHSSRTSYAVAADLSKMELKKIMIEKMEGNKSIQRSDEQRNLYKALVEAYDADKTILDTYGESTILKRRREDDDQEGPSAGSDRGSKRQIEGGEHASASTSSEPTTGSPTCQMEEPSHPVFETGADDQPIIQTTQHPEWFSQPRRPPTLDPQSWISILTKQTDARSSFNELLDTPIDFSNFIMNRLGVDTLTPELLAGPTYELMKGSCNSLTELEYHLEEVYKPLPLILDNRGRSVIPFEHFINNDLEYLRGGASSRKYTTSVTKTKAAYYGHIKWIEDLVPRAMWIQEPMSYDKHALWEVSHWGRIIAVTELKIVEWHNFKHLDWVLVRRDDDKIYKFKEGDLKRLRIQDIEDMLLLLVQRKLSNMTVEKRFAFNVSLRMFTRSIVIQRRVEDLQLGVESYQKRLNLTKPDTYRSDLKRREAYTAHSNPRGFIYQNKDKKIRLMRIDELHKFSDGTLNDVRNALDDRLKGIRMHYLPTTIWRRGDKARAAAMIQEIDKMLKTRRIMRSLERFVGGR
nr:hypothetical protein [Tanacetum cinerariifolium]